MRKIFALIISLIISSWSFSQNFRVNQVAYEQFGPKVALIEASSGNASSFTTFEVLDVNNQVAFSGEVLFQGSVSGWSGRVYWSCDFTGFQEIGEFTLKANNVVSHEFSIGNNILFEKTAFATIDFFNAMRHPDNEDTNLPFNGDRQGTVDLHGGWYDATGDPGKHLSHLSYANHFNPQQIPMVLWSMLEVYEENSNAFANKENALLAECAFGADYLIRSQDVEGYFYLAVFDDWGGSAVREVTEWGLEDCNSCRSDNYQAAFREGAGISIAALAKAARIGISGEYTPSEYLQHAESAYAHLTALDSQFGSVNEKYDNDHIENIIDDYCALVAAVELFKTTSKTDYLTDAQSRAQSLLDRQQVQGWFASDLNGNRPFYHAAEEGMPVVALTEYMEISQDKDVLIKTALSNWYSWYESITNEVTNPFNYVRQYRKPYIDGQLGQASTAFFVPHDNETGYWWQGENARLASMTTAILRALPIIDNNFNFGNNNGSRLAMAQLDWILGKNPFDVCMMTGVGSVTYPDYLDGGAYAQNHYGGICNGISAMDSDETNIDWAPSQDNDWTNWRWVEQWLPHDAWYLLAVSEVNSAVNNRLGGISIPQVEILTPNEGASYQNYETVMVTVNAIDTSSEVITKVELYSNGVFMAVDYTAPYEFEWIPNATGDVKLKAVATSSSSSMGSDQINVEVSVSGQTPYGNMQLIPGVIELENYDHGGQGVAYNDLGAGNEAGSYRNDDVDIELCSDINGGFNIGYLEAGEWLEYTVLVQYEGGYDLEARVAANAAQSNGGSFRVEIDGEDITGAIPVDPTGGWQDWSSVYSSGLSLAKGVHILRVYFIETPFNINNLTLDIITSSSDETSNSVNVYPNPAHDRLIIEGADIEKFKVCSVTGELLWHGDMESEVLQLSIEDWAAGVYFVAIHRKNGIETHRFVKE